jgi:hypothetical protein
MPEPAQMGEYLIEDLSEDQLEMVSGGETDYYMPKPDDP